MIILFWDIDGTLLTTGKAGVPAWEQAVLETTGREFQLSSIRIDGLSDYLIAVRTFELLGLDAEEAADDSGWCAGTRACSHHLPLRQGRVLPNVREILELMAPRTDVRSYLLTGNTRGGAAAKLTHYDLMEVLSRRRFRRRYRRPPLDCRPGPRSGPARRACRRRTLFVVGDTPHDVHAANAIAARTIAVATGGYTVAELEAHHPWRVFDELPHVGEFLTLVDAAG